MECRGRALELRLGGNALLTFKYGIFESSSNPIQLKALEPHGSASLGSAELSSAEAGCNELRAAAALTAWASALRVSTTCNATARRSYAPSKIGKRSKTLPIGRRSYTTSKIGKLDHFQNMKASDNTGSS